MIVGVGIDTVDVPEFRADLSDSRIRELFLPDEIAYATSRARPWESYAARLAAKRAAFRALGLRGDVPWKHIEIVRPVSGGLDLKLAGQAREAAEALGVGALHVSVAHTRTSATAIVFLEGRATAGSDPEPGPRRRSAGTSTNAKEAA